MLAKIKFHPFREMYDFSLGRRRATNKDRGGKNPFHFLSLLHIIKFSQSFTHYDIHSLAHTLFISSHYSAKKSGIPAAAVMSFPMSLLESLKEPRIILVKHNKTFLNRENLRGVTVCFGIGEERPFYIEKVPSLLMERIRLNLSLFYLNYMLLTAVLFVLTLLISPSAIIGIGLLALAWMYVIKSTQSGAMQIYGTFRHVIRNVVSRVLSILTQ